MRDPTTTCAGPAPTHDHTTTREARYLARFTAPETLPHGAPFAMAEAIEVLADEDEPQTAKEAASICRYYGATAELLDSSGAVVGECRADGSYRVLVAEAAA